MPPVNALVPSLIRQNGGLLQRNVLRKFEISYRNSVQRVSLRTRTSLRLHEENTAAI